MQNRICTLTASPEKNASVPFPPVHDMYNTGAECLAQDFSPDFGRKLLEQEGVCLILCRFCCRSNGRGLVLTVQSSFLKTANHIDVVSWSRIWSCGSHGCKLIMKEVENL